MTESNNHALVLSADEALEMALNQYGNDYHEVYVKKLDLQSSKKSAYYQVNLEIDGVDHDFEIVASSDGSTDKEDEGRVDKNSKEVEENDELLDSALQSLLNDQESKSTGEEESSSQPLVVAREEKQPDRDEEGSDEGQETPTLLTEEQILNRVQEDPDLDGVEIKKSVVELIDQDHYLISFSSGKKNYRYKMDAHSGKILKKKMMVPPAKSAEKKELTEKRDKTKEKLSPQAQSAFQQALQDAQLEEKEVDLQQIKKREEDGLKFYEVSFTSPTASFNYRLHAQSLAILSRQRLDKRTTADFITRTQALDLVLETNGWQRSDIDLLKLELHQPAGQAIYVMEFEREGELFNYEVSAEKGEIIEDGRDEKGQEEDKLTADEAVELAYKKAGITEKQATDLQVEDLGNVYKIIFTADDEEYESFIRAYDG